MFFLHRPDAAAIERFIADSRALPLSYDPVGLASSGRAGFDLDELITVVGSYVVRAASRPRAALARLGYPVVRTLQTRFRRDSTEAMRRAVADN